ncbi:hypothetical protein Godav_027818 [Gossypium davidsonii]|uniref:Uncharacterized protein n=1 Tax=Gossypium davidsonii TaxID=34287 RepID=A0A7J8RXE2_GOSDV|nr:hypothetical protein [Gossypium davidsonii]
MRVDLDDEKQSLLSSSSLSSSSRIGKAMKRALSISSTNDVVYCRIAHQYDSVPVVEDEITIMVVHIQKESDKMGNKILEACRELHNKAPPQDYVRARWRTRVIDCRLP